MPGVAEKNALSGVQFVTNIKIPTCFGTRAPSVGNYRTKKYKSTRYSKYYIARRAMQHINIYIKFYGIVKQVF